MKTLLALILGLSVSPAIAGDMLQFDSTANGLNLTPSSITVTGTGSNCVSIDSPTFQVGCDRDRVTTEGGGGIVNKYGITSSSMVLTFAGTALDLTGSNASARISNGSINVTVGGGGGAQLTMSDGTGSGTLAASGGSGERATGILLSGANGHAAAMRGGTTAGDKAQIIYYSASPSLYASAFEVPAVAAGKSTATVMGTGGSFVIGASSVTFKGPLPASAGANGVYLCIDEGGTIYQKSSCP